MFWDSFFSSRKSQSVPSEERVHWYDIVGRPGGSFTRRRILYDNLGIYSVATWNEAPGRYYTTVVAGVTQDVEGHESTTEAKATTIHNRMVQKYKNKAAPKYRPSIYDED